MFSLKYEWLHQDFFLISYKTANERERERCEDTSQEPSCCKCDFRCRYDAIILRARPDLCCTHSCASCRRVWGVAAMLPHHVAPACFPLIKYPFSDVLSYCFRRALQSHSEEMQRGETEGSLRHNGLITMRRLSLAWLNNHCNTFCFSLVAKNRNCSSGY